MLDLDKKEGAGANSGKGLGGDNNKDLLHPGEEDSEK